MSSQKLGHMAKLKKNLNTLEAIILTCQNGCCCSLIPDLENMYTLLKPTHGGLNLLVQEVEEHIKTVGLEAVNNLKGDSISVSSSSFVSLVELQ